MGGEKISCFSGHYDVPPRSSLQDQCIRPSRCYYWLRAVPPSPDNCSRLTRATNDSLVQEYKRPAPFNSRRATLWNDLCSKALTHLFLFFIFLQILIDHAFPLHWWDRFLGAKSCWSSISICSMTEDARCRETDAHENPRLAASGRIFEAPAVWSMMG